ncbi:Diacylglycerol kinase family enzyme [Cohaesibacter sp. ES.047]|uniref:diacylglycerol/lipid kinase family protein n=1 Tax=Cohaesibacter sp. ES.047 TaxID=1798205 RepID=UPI000BB91DDA|nr:diacylglycerol kinase family protein [Cohaesibacter sp. ES.047]SNY90477.1 Diacylglycerol kinase family enzyme [Cohaesibacter sp. ES.047]
MTEHKKKAMAFINENSGTFQMLNVGDVERMIKSRFKASGHDVTIYTAPGKELIEAMQKSVKEDAFDILIAGGGDGTISAAADLAWRHGKTLAVVPGGTMNLYARTLGIPLDVETAIGELAGGHAMACDIATANGKSFVHQFSIGLHPRMVRMRNNIAFGARFTKMLASVRAYWGATSQIPVHEMTIRIDGEDFERNISALSISNNLYSSSAPPHAEIPDGGKLGIYMVGAMNRGDALTLGADLFLGLSEQNENLEVRTGQKVEIILHNKKHASRCVQDGELYSLPDQVAIELHPKELNVLAVENPVHA